jgi:prolyl-tRNA editing enzyme YbaK/EbsC (Cys-tRNA(Pro) deacylase)
MTAPLSNSPPATERVRAALAVHGLSVEISEFPQGTRTAVDAAQAVGTTVAQIVKSLVFLADGRAVLALVSGAVRVDENKLASATGAAVVEKASAEATRAATGFSIGGVPPVAHATPLPVYFDETLLSHAVVYAAAGTPRALFAIDPKVLARLTGASIVDLAHVLGPA